MPAEIKDEESAAATKTTICKGVDEKKGIDTCYFGVWYGKFGCAHGLRAVVVLYTMMDLRCILVCASHYVRLSRDRGIYRE